MTCIDEADKVVHSVEKEWHYPIFTKYGFNPLIREATGLVRSYDYVNASGHKITWTTGYSSDRWRDVTSDKWGYWSDLEAHLQGLAK